MGLKLGVKARSKEAKSIIMVAKRKNKDDN
jgi:hypothetical protein